MRLNPPCPRCESDVLVDGFRGEAAYICWACDQPFDPPGDSETARQRRHN